jgi:retinol dehydrogenase-12
MLRKTAVITGATSGIGFHTASALAAAGYRVFVTGRDSTRGRAAEEQLRNAAGHEEVHFIRADASTVRGNHELAQQILGTVPAIDVLVNNVGGAYNDRLITADGYEASLAINFVGPAALTQALMPALNRASVSRVVNVASAAYAMWKGDAFADLGCERRYLGSDAYARAKLLNIWWTFALARRLGGTGTFANSVDPGMAWTAMTQGIASRSMPMWLRAAWPLLRAFQWSGDPKTAARSSVFAAMHPAAAGLNGAFVDPRCTPRQVALLADEACQERAWVLAGQHAALGV